jgi:hypothetical protein
MDKIGGVILLVVCLAAAYLGWDTSRESPEVELKSRTAACGPLTGCTVEADRPFRVERNAFRHRYDWKTSLGAAIVECRREQMWLGEWRCTVDREAVGAADVEVGAFPDSQQRGQVR